MDVVLAAAVSVGAVVYGHAALRFARTLRRESDERWRAQWRALDRPRKKRITRAIRRGDAVAEPDTELALRAIAQIETTLRAIVRLELTAWPLAVVAVVLGLVYVDLPTILVLTFGIPLVVLAVGLVVSAHRQRRRLRRSAEAMRRPG